MDRAQHCEAYFYLGQHALIAGKSDEATRLFQQAVDSGVVTSNEYGGAQAELKRLSVSRTHAGH
jgi:lipoprotein NlpI